MSNPFEFENDAVKVDIVMCILHNAPHDEIPAILKEFGEKPDFLKLILREMVSSFRLKLAISILENAENAENVSALLAVFGQNLKFLKRILEEKISNDLRLKIAKWVVENSFPVEKIIPAPVEEEPVEKIIPPVEEEPAKEKPAEEEPAKEKPAEEKPAEEKSDEEEFDEEEPAEEESDEEEFDEEKPAKKEPAEEEPDEKGFTVVYHKSTRPKAQAQAQKPSYRTPRTLHTPRCLECDGSVQVYNGEPNSYCSGCYNGMKPDCNRNGCKNKCNSYTDYYGNLCYNHTCKECWEDRPWCKKCKKVQVAFDPYREKFNPLCGDCHSVTNKY